MPARVLRLHVGVPGLQPGAVGDDHDPGRVGAVGVVPADVGDDAVARRADRRARTARRCRCRWWKWAQMPERRLPREPGAPEVLGHVARPSASASVPLYCDGMLPCWVCLRDDGRDLALRAASGRPRPRRAPCFAFFLFALRPWRTSRFWLGQAPLASPSRAALRSRLRRLELLQARVERRASGRPSPGAGRRSGRACRRRSGGARRASPGRGRSARRAPCPARRRRGSSSSRRACR